VREGGVVDESLEARAAFERRVGELRRRRSGFPDPNRPLHSLLQAITWLYKIRDETVAIEATSTSRRAMADVKRETQGVAEDELARADLQYPDVEEGLRAARAAGGGPIAFDSRDPEQDRVAGALIAYLVATDFATVQTEELGGERYRYHVAVDWARLDDLARRLDLPPVADMLARR
jgi:hypothetical protein